MIVLLVIHRRTLRVYRVKLMREQRLRASAQARLGEVAALHDMANLLNLHGNRRRLLDLVCRRLKVVFEADLAAILLIEDEGGPLAMAAAHGPATADLAGMQVKVGDGLVGRIARYGKGVAIASRQLQAPGHRAEAALRSVPFLLMVPIRVRSEILGVLIVGGGKSLARNNRLSLLSIFAESLGWVITRDTETRSLRERGLRYEQANRELVDVNRKGEIFLATATHELRTPLSGIVSYAEVLADYYDTMTDGERRPLCTELNDQCKTMMGLVDELFDFARLESGRLTLDPEETRIGELVASAIDLMEATAAKHDITIERQLNVDLPIIVDPTKIRQCLLNLISNAVKFTEPGGTVSVSLDMEGDLVQVTISDTGRGIEPEELDRIFELYRSTAGRKVKGVKGLGLGLYLVKSFIELHRGSIQVWSVPGEGSTFRFSLPRSPGRLASGSDVARAA